MSSENFLIFNGKNLLDFKCKISGGGTFGSSDWDVELIQVPGRDGDIVLSNGRVNQQTISYEAYIAEDFAKNIECLRNFLMQDAEYHRIEDTYHPDQFLKARFLGGLDPTTVVRNLGGTFTLKFSCIPRRYLKAGEQETDLKTSTELFNFTSNKAYPLIKIFGTGEITIGDVTIKVLKNSQNYLVLDCDEQEAYAVNNDGTVSYFNGNIELSSANNEYSFPVLMPGKNKIVLKGVTAKITPRWYIR